MSRGTPTRVLSEHRVTERIDRHRGTLWRWIKAGTFPKPIKLGPNSNGWIEAEIEEWFRARIEIRDAERRGDSR